MEYHAFIFPLFTVVNNFLFPYLLLFKENYNPMFKIRI